MVNAMRSKGAAIAMVAFAALVMSAAPALAASPINVQGTVVSGSVASVSVRNTSILPAVGTLRVEAMINGTPTVRFTSVVLLPGQRAIVNVNFGCLIGNLITVGLSDDANPF